MTSIELSKIVKQDRAKVYELLKDMEAFPKFMQGVKKLEIIKKDKNRLVTSWEVEVDGARVIWKEENIFNDPLTSMRFKMLEGDYSSYDGYWKLETVPKGTKITLSANLDWGVPAFEKLLGNLLNRKAFKSLRSMLNAIKKRLDSK